MTEATTAGPDLDHLSSLYQLEEQEGWRLFRNHLKISEGFSFLPIFAPDDWGVALLRREAGRLLESPESMRRAVFDPAAPPESLADTLLNLPEIGSAVQMIWVDADPGIPQQLLARDEAWRHALSRLNRHRNTLQQTIPCTLVLAGPVRLQPILREAAPDLWSIRSAVVRIEASGAARTALELLPMDERIRLEPREDWDSGDPDQTLAEAERLRGKPGRELLLAELLRRAGRQAVGKLKWDLSLKSLQEAYTLQEHHGGDPEFRFQIANDLSQVLKDLGKYDRALHYAHLALETAESSLGPGHPAVPVALNNLAQLLQDTNRLAEAEEPMRRALAIDEASFGPDHPDVAIDLNNLAQLLQATNRLAEAEEPMRRALAIDEASFGPDHPNVAIDLNNLALLLQATNRLAEAEEPMRRALAIDEASFGPDHPNVAIRLNNLATLLQATNRLAEAEEPMRRHVEIFVKFTRATGHPHPHLEVALRNYAGLLQAMGRDEAEIEAALRVVREGES